MLRVLRFVALLLAALGLSLGAAHVLELGPKLGYAPALYVQVTSTLYLYFGVIGGPIQVAALAATCALAVATRGFPGFRAAVLAAVALAVSLVLWAALVAPVNAAWARALEAADPVHVMEAYARHRPRWEYGHVAAFVAWLAGFCALVASVLADTPEQGAPASRGIPR